MKAALLPDRGVVKVAGDGARNFLHGLVTADILNLTPAQARFCALLTPQGKIIADFIAVAGRASEGGGFFLDVARALAPQVVAKLNIYKLRAKVIVEDLSDGLGVAAVWDGNGPVDYGLAYDDPRLLDLGRRIMLAAHQAAAAASRIGAELVDASAYEAHRIALGVPRGGVDFVYGDAFPHETDMDQLNGIDFGKGCYVGQEVVSRMEHRGTARTRAVAVDYDGHAPDPGIAVVAGERPIGKLGSTAGGHGIAMIRLDRAADALARGEMLSAGGIPIRIRRSNWARFSLASESKAAE